MITWLWLVGGLVVIVGAVVAGNPRLRRAAVRSMRRRVRRAPVGRGARTARPGGRAAPAPLTSGAQRVGRPGVGTTRCSAACRMSRKPAFDKHNRLTCDCPCKGRDHGRYRPGSSASLRGAPGRKAVRTAPRPPAARPPATPTPPAPVPAPARSATPAAPHADPDGTVHSPTADRGWKSLTGSSRQAMADHAKSNPACVGGSVSARTIRDNRTTPPKVTQQLTCDTCKADLT